MKRRISVMERQLRAYIARGGTRQWQRDADARDFAVMLDAATIVASAGAHHRVLAGYGLTAEEYRALV